MYLVQRVAVWSVAEKYFKMKQSHFNMVGSANVKQNMILRLFMRTIGKLNNSHAPYSVGRCVIPCAFFGKSVKHTFSCRKMYPVYEKRCLQFIFGVLTSQ